MRIAVGFDGVIVENNYPRIGEEIPDAIATLKKLQHKDHHIILWTRRIGSELKEAIQFCSQKDLFFYAINENFPGELYSENYARKISADIYIEAHLLKNNPCWAEIYWYICLMEAN